MRTSNHRVLLFTHAYTVILPSLPFTAMTRERASHAGIRLRRIRAGGEPTPQPSPGCMFVDGTSVASPSRLRPALQSVTLMIVLVAFSIAFVILTHR